MEQRYQAALKQQGFTDAEVRQEIKLQLIREDVFKKVTKDVKVSDDEIKTYYDKHKHAVRDAGAAESRDVRHILVKTKALADQHLRAAAGERRASSQRSRRSTRPDTALEGTTAASSAGPRQGPDRAAVRQGRLLDQDERDLEAGARRSSAGTSSRRSGRSSRQPDDADVAQVKEAIRQQLLAARSRTTR